MMEFVQKYRILFIVTLAFAGGAFYEINYVDSVSDYVPGMGQPNPAAELLIELYPQRPGSKCLEADRAVYLRYDLQTAKRNLEAALSQNYKDDASYFYNYAIVLMLLNAPPDEIEDAVRQWRLNGIPVQNELDPRLLYKGVTLPLPLEEGATRLMVKSLDGRRVATATEQSPGAPVRITQVHDLFVSNPAYRPVNISAASRFTAINLSHDGSHFISANEGGVITIINLDTQKLLHRIPTSSGDIFAVAVIPNRDVAITANRSGVVQTWSLTEGRVIRSQKASQRPISAIAVSPDESHLATGDWDGNVVVWDFDDANSIQKVGSNEDAHQGVITKLVFGSDNVTIASASRDHTARIFKIGATLEMGLMVKHEAPIYGLDLSSSGEQLLTTGEDQMIAIWSTDDGKLARKEFKAYPVYSALFTAKSNEIMMVNEQQAISYSDMSLP